MYASSERLSPLPDPEVEGPCELNFLVTIKANGYYSVVERQVTQFMGLAMHRNFGEQGYKLYDEEGVQIVFDSYAHDGEHEGHVRIITMRK